MKKYLAIIGAVLATAAASFAQASASLTIQGTVLASTTITIASQSGYNSLNLASTASGQVVGIATETSNDYKGYKVTLSSLNAGTGTQAYLKGGYWGTLMS